VRGLAQALSELS